MPVWVNLIKKKKKKQDGGKDKRPQMSEIIRVVKAAVCEQGRFWKISLFNPPLTLFLISRHLNSTFCPRWSWSGFSFYVYVQTTWKDSTLLCQLILYGIDKRSVPVKNKTKQQLKQIKYDGQMFSPIGFCDSEWRKKWHFEIATRQRLNKPLLLLFQLVLKIRSDPYLIASSSRLRPEHFYELCCDGRTTFVRWKLHRPRLSSRSCLKTCSGVSTRQEKRERKLSFSE